MIIIKLTGGLGNQMFQYAIGLKLSLSYGYPFYLDIESYGWDKFRRFELNTVFGVTEPIAEPNTKEICRLSHRYLFFDRLIRKIRGGDFPYYLKPVFEEPSFRFDPNIFRVSDNTYISGHFQSEKYFKSIDKEIRNRFQFAIEPNAYYSELGEIINFPESISVHIRRGDYVTDSATSRFHGICSLEYYNSAILWMREHLKHPIFVFVSDDMDWTKSHFKHISDAIFVENNKGPAYEDLRIMTICKHNIIANSSFSWWGAWLNPNGQKYVVAPKIWFADAEMQKQVDSIYPESWKIL
jgi:hypothetical protein